MKNRINKGLKRIDDLTKNKPSTDYFVVKDRKLYICRRSSDVTAMLYIGDVNSSSQKVLASEYDIFNIDNYLNSGDDNKIEIDPTTLIINGHIIRVRDFNVDLSLDMPDQFVTEDTKSFVDKIQLNETMYSTNSKGMSKVIFQVNDRLLNIITTNGLMSTTTAFFDLYHTKPKIYTFKDKAIIKGLRPLISEYSTSGEIRIALDDHFVKIETDDMRLNIHCFELDKSKQLKLWEFSQGESIKINKANIVALSKTIKGFGSASALEVFKARYDNGLLTIYDKDDNVSLEVESDKGFNFDGPTYALSISRLRLGNEMYINMSDAGNKDFALITIFDDVKSKFISFATKKGL